MKAWLASAFLAFFVRSVSSQLTTWDNQLFDFGWNPYNPTIDRCSTIGIGWSDRTTANPRSTSPYTISIYCGGYQPVVVATVPGRGYNWTVNLPVGGPYILSMKDANGYTGGDSLAFTVQDPTGGSTCPNGTYSQNSLQLTSTGTDAECSELVVTATGGTAPYTMNVIVAQRPPKTTTWTTSTMSYTIDVTPSEQFFVMVTDANGLVGIDGIHTVTNGDTGCYSLATTVSAGSLATTLSYDPTSTVSFPHNSTTTTNVTGPTQVIQNTATTTLITTITASDGSTSVLTLPPGGSATVADVNGNNASSGTSVPLAAIVGGAVGGGAFILILLILFFWWRRRATEVRQAQKREMYERRRLSDPPQPMPVSATIISPFPPTTPGRDTAPLMGSTYSAGSGITGSAYTAASVNNPAGASYFGTHTQVTNPTYEESAPTWSMPIGATSASSPGYSSYPGGGSSPMTMTTDPPPQTPRRAPSASSSSWNGEGRPPGAMAPRIGVSAASGEKATFTPSRPVVAAPPPYSHGS